MPAPSTSLATLRPDLGGSLMEFDLAMSRQGFIAQRVLPIFNTIQQAGPFGRIPLEQLLKAASTDRASKSGYPRGNWNFTTDTYACEEHGFEQPVDDRNARMYADYFDAELVCAQLAQDIVLRNAEQRAADLIFNATIWTGSALTTAVTNEWDDATNATPVADVKAAKFKVFDGSGLWPNALIINRKVFNNVRECDEVIDRLKYSGHTDPKSKSITAQVLAQLFDLDEVIVADSAKNTAKEGQTASISQIWSGEYAMICRVAKTSMIEEPCIGRTLHWAADGSVVGGTVETYRDETARADIVRVRHDVDEKRLITECGHLLSNITT